MLNQALLITLFGMAATFFALGLVMLSMLLLTRLARNGKEIEPAETVTETPASTSLELDPALPIASLPAGTPLEEVAAAAVAVAVARELGRQRSSARVWLDPQPRSLISPWQLVARDRQLDRLKQ